MEHNIVTFISVIVVASFAISIFYYGLSEGIWFTFGIYDQLFGKIIEIIFGLLDSIFM